MYPIFLGLHSWTRWILILAALLLLLRSISGYRKSAPYTSTDQLLAALFFWALNLQFVLGLSLYVFFSPYTHAAFNNLSEVMSNTTLRFFLIEHPLAMFLAIGAGQSGIKKAKLAVDEKKKHLELLKAAGASLFFILIGIPWPFLPYGRMLFFL